MIVKGAAVAESVYSVSPIEAEAVKVTVDESVRTLEREAEILTSSPHSPQV